MLADKLSKLNGNEDAGALVEGALAIPVFLLFFVGVIAWNYFLFSEVVILYATESAARCGAMPGGTAKLCESVGVAGRKWSLGLVSSDTDVFNGQISQYSGSNPFTQSCVVAGLSNPLAFLSMVSMPANAGATFCRPKL